jgi:DNA/RNA endonuclease YhcR with UshA esterase domain
MKRYLVSVWAVLALAAFVGAAEEGASSAKADKPVIKASDKEALEKNKDKDVTVEGKVSEAAWSKSGKVMNVKFEGTEESGFGAAIFQRSKEAFDKAFDGDAAKALTGATVKVTGKLGTFRDKPQIILNTPGQVKVEKGEETAQAGGADKPAEKPTELPKP